MQRMCWKVWVCLSVLLSVGPVLGICCRCSLLLSRHNSGISLHALHVSAVVAIIRYIEPLQSPFLLSAVPHPLASVYALGEGSVVYTSGGQLNTSRGPNLTYRTPSRARSSVSFRRAAREYCPPPQTESVTNREKNNCI
jgi:hypothetical protein